VLSYMLSVLCYFSFARIYLVFILLLCFDISLNESFFTLTPSVDTGLFLTPLNGHSFQIRSIFCDKSSRLKDSPRSPATTLFTPPSDDTRSRSLPARSDVYYTLTTLPFHLPLFFSLFSGFFLPSTRDQKAWHTPFSLFPPTFNPQFSLIPIPRPLRAGTPRIPPKGYRSWRPVSVILGTCRQVLCLYSTVTSGSQ